MQGSRQMLASPRVVGGGLVVVLCLPLLVALAVLRSPRWYPLGDLAMVELRVRDVGLSDPPLLGLPGRITGHDLPGSHLGPLSFYALAPTWRLLGASAWALKAAIVVLDAVAIGLALWMVRRRAGAAAPLGPVLGMAAMLALLLRAYGPHLLTEPWNPFMPVLWWVVFLLAVWCVLDDDVGFLPLAVFAGSFCVQTHVSYLGLVPALGLLAAAVVGRRFWLVRRNPVDRRRLLVWGGVAAGLAVVLWLPPVAEELTNDPGNMSIVVDNFREPDGEEISFGTALDLWFARLDPRGFVTGNLPAPGWGTTGPALLLLGAWAVTAAATMRVHKRQTGNWIWSSSTPTGEESDRAIETVLCLHLVVAAALATGLVSLTRVFGIPWYYLHLWGWGTTALVVFVTVWSGALLLAATAAEPSSDRSGHWISRLGVKSSAQNRLRRVGGVALGLLLVVTTISFTYDAARTDMPAERMTAALRGVAPTAIDALTAPDAPGGGRDGRYLIRWNDPLGIGDQGWGLLDEMERAGIDVYVDPAPPEARAGDLRLILDRGARGHRQLAEADATAVVTLAIGPAIDPMRDQPGAVEVAYHEPRTPAERRRYDELRRRVEQELIDKGLAAEVDLDGSLFALAAQRPDLSTRAQRALAEMQVLGLPLAVFVTPT